MARHSLSVIKCAFGRCRINSLGSTTCLWKKERKKAITNKKHNKRRRSGGKKIGLCFWMRNCICSDDCYCLNVTCTICLPKIQNIFYVNSISSINRNSLVCNEFNKKANSNWKTRDALVKHVLENSFVWCYLGDFWIFLRCPPSHRNLFRIHLATHNFEPFTHAMEQLNTDSQNCAIQINSMQIYSPIFEFIIEIFFRVENVFSTHCCSLTAHDREKEREKRLEVSANKKLSPAKQPLGENYYFFK